MILRWVGQRGRGPKGLLSPEKKMPSFLFMKLGRKLERGCQSFRGWERRGCGQVQLS